jgi:hypothetical protein
MGWIFWVSNPGMGKRCILILNIQTGSGTYPASYSIGTGHFLPGGKAGHLLPSTVNNCRYISTPLVCLNGMYRDFTFCLRQECR